MVAWLNTQTLRDADTQQEIYEASVCNQSHKAQMVQFVMMYKVVLALNLKSVNNTQPCDHLNESYWAVVSCDTINYAVQGGSNF